jgi:hypothetical protein
MAASTLKRVAVSNPPFGGVLGEKKCPDKVILRISLRLNDRDSAAGVPLTPVGASMKAREASPAIQIRVFLVDPLT